MQQNIAPKAAVVGKAAYEALAPFTKRELGIAMSMGLAGGFGWKLLHWSEKRKIQAVNDGRKAALLDARAKYQARVAEELRKRGLE